nr:reverse transcriptase domain-containing protein [Tanacetum cinerariifolium]GEX19995.1 reverse transcriptase domain-containing protein [Tanacetum cinerariifolium]
MTSDQFFGLENDNPHDHIRWFNKITSTIKYKDVPNLAIKFMLFPFSLVGEARRWLEKEPSCSILTWEDLISKFINEFFPSSRTTNLRNEISSFQQWFDESFQEVWDRYKDLLRTCPHHGFTELQQLDTFYNALNPTDQDCLNSATGGNLLERRTQDVLKIIENKSKVRNSQNKSIVSQAKSSDANSSSSSEIAKLTHGVNQQASDVTTVMTAILKQFQATRPPASVKVIEEICVTCGGAHPYYQDPLHLNIPYPLRMHKQKQQEKDEIQIHKFWQMFKQLHINITLADALILIPKYQKMIKALLSNKEKLLELVNTPLNENCSAVILKKLPEKLGDPGKFLILCSFSLPELTSTRMTFELANEAICTPAGIARDVFVPVGKFTFPADFFIVDYKSNPRVPLILGRPFLQNVCALIDVHGEEMILRNGDERLTLNMRHDTSSYTNQPQKESINMINIYNDSCEDYLEDLFATNHLSGNLTFSFHTDLTSPEVKDYIFDLEGDIVLIEKLLNLDSTKELPSTHNINPLSASTTSCSSNQLLEEFADELALIKFPPKNDDLPFDIESDLRELEYLLNNDPTKEWILFSRIRLMKVYALPSTNNEDKVFNPGILIHENLSEVIVQATPDKNEKKISMSHASLILEDFNPPLYELPFHKEVLGFKTLLSFSSENEEKNFKPEILTSKGVHTSLLSELSHRGPKTFKVIKILEIPMEIFPCSFGEEIRILDVPCLHFYPP